MGVSILLVGRHLPKGALSSPGPGLYPTLLAVMLLILSSFLIIRRGKESEGKSFPPLAIVARRICPAYAALIGYVILLDYLGFVTVSLILMFFLFTKIGRLRWYTAVSSAVLSIGGAYVVFELLLRTNLPKGPIGF